MLDIRLNEIMAVLLPNLSIGDTPFFEGTPVMSWAESELEFASGITVLILKLKTVLLEIRDLDQLSRLSLE